MSEHDSGVIKFAAKLGALVTTGVIGTDIATGGGIRKAVGLLKNDINRVKATPLLDMKAPNFDNIPQVIPDNTGTTDIVGFADHLVNSPPQPESFPPLSLLLDAAHTVDNWADVIGDVTNLGDIGGYGILAIGGFIVLKKAGNMVGSILRG
jgi:hypothetical protein